MVDKGFDIQNDLKKLDLKINILPYLKDKVGFEDVIKMQTVARHGIHVERAINLYDKEVLHISLHNSCSYVW